MPPIQLKAISIKVKPLIKCQLSESFFRFSWRTCLSVTLFRCLCVPTFWRESATTATVPTVTSMCPTKLKCVMTLSKATVQREKRYTNIHTVIVNTFFFLLLLFIIRFLGYKNAFITLYFFLPNTRQSRHYRAPHMFWKRDIVFTCLKKALLFCCCLQSTLWTISAYTTNTH